MSDGWESAGAQVQEQRWDLAEWSRCRVSDRVRIKLWAMVVDQVLGQVFHQIQGMMLDPEGEIQHER
jgi:hypothetical protein